MPRPGAVGAASQKKTPHASEQGRKDVAAARETWREEVCAGSDPAGLAFLDETGVDTAMTRAHARAPRGERAVGRVPGGRWKRPTVSDASGLDGVVRAMAVAAATNTRVFLAHVERVLIPALAAEPGCTVVVDNLAPHEAACVREALEAACIAHRYLPAYSPDPNPIEQAWSKLKAWLRTRGARGLAQLDKELPNALERITPQDAQGWFRHCGYRSKP